MKLVILTSIALALCLPAYSADLEERPSETTRPNILLILADDLGYADLGIQGCTEFGTPHIDSIAQNGIRFTNGYVSNSVCAPSRAGLLSGRIGIGFEANPPQNSEHGLNVGLETMADTLKRGGYSTSCIGKWHLGELDEHYPTARGFDYFCGLRMGSRSYWYEPGNSDKPGDPKAIEINGEQVKFDGYLTDYFTDKAIEVIESHTLRGSGDPFFMYLSYTAPHGPMHCKPGADEKFGDVIKNPKRRIYAAMVESLDEGVGRVLKTLEKQGLRDDTLVVFLSDNGGPLQHNGSSNSPLQGAKGSLWEGGVRVPFMLQWPGKIVAGQVRDQQVSSLDLLPTFAALAGVEPPENMSGISLASWLPDPRSRIGDRPLFWRRADKANCALRSGRFKWLERREIDAQYLFDLEEDIGEKNNLIEQQPELAEKMRSSFAKWEKSIPDPAFSSGWRPKKKAAPPKAKATPKAKAAPKKASGAKPRPNIVLIYADDIGFGDLGCYGGIGAKTPNVDQLASAGIRFLSAYSAAATCTPSRYSLLSGEYAFRNKDAEILPGNAPLIMDPARPTMASFLRDNGYATALVGKWHLGLGETGAPLDWNQLIKPGPKEVGFDYSFHMAATADRVPSVYIENGRIVGLDPSDPVQVSYGEPVGDDPTGLTHPGQLRWGADKQHSGTIVNKISRIGFMSGGASARFRDEDMADTYVAKAVEFIDSNRDKPFFLYFAPNENHVPRAVHERFQGTSTLGPRGDALSAFDWCVGHIVEVLEERGLDENTLIILSSDNGPVLFDGYRDDAITKRGDHRAAGPWRGGKYSRREGGTRVPFIVSWPGRVQPGISEAQVSQVDLFASLSALLGKKLPDKAGQDGVNVLPVLLGETERGRDYIVQEAWKELAVRKGNWKYIPPGKISERGGFDEWKVTKVNEPGLLFDLVKDPGETKDLAALHPNKVKELRQIISSVKAKAPPEPEKAKAKPVGEWLAPARAITNITCKPPDGIRFQPAGEAAWSIGGKMKNKAATLVLRPEGEAWDISGFGYFRVDFVNKGTGLIWIRGRLDNPGAEDWWNSSPSQAFVMPGERGTLAFPYPRPVKENDAPPIFDSHSGKPNAHRFHWKAFDPSNVVACRLRIQSTSPDLALEQLEISLAQPYGAEANAELLELPYLDRFGQVRQLDWPGKLYGQKHLAQRRDSEQNALANDHGPKSFNRYGGWADGPQLVASGFFRTEKVDGKWWLVDPEGRLFFSHGANSVSFAQLTPVNNDRRKLFEWLPREDDPLMKGVLRNSKIHFREANLARTFGAEWREAANDRTHRRLRRWGMNTLGAWSDKELVEDGQTPYTAILHLGGDWSPLGHGIPDPFSEGFANSLAKGLNNILGTKKEDPLCIGVFIDNEIDWTEKFVHKTFKLGEQQPARVAAAGWLEDKYGEIEKLNRAWATEYASWEKIGALPDDETEALAQDVVALTRLIAGTYYKACRDAMRDILPNHLYLGSRMHKAPREVMEEAAKYVDVLSLNSYEPLSGSKVPAGVDVPCIDTEFHFAAPDRGLPGLGMWPIGDQLQRSRAYVAYVLSGLLHPNMVGTHWFAYADQSAAGRQGVAQNPGENHQIGFVDVTDSPYPEITKASRQMANRMYAIASDKDAKLLVALESLWSGSREETTVNAPAPEPRPAPKPAPTTDSSATPDTTGFPYRIEKATGLEVKSEDGKNVATGKGALKLILKPTQGDTWDMNSVSVLGIMAKNTGPSDLVLDLMLQNDGATGWSNSALGRTIVKAGEEMPLGVALCRTGDYKATHPAYLRMSGRPDGRFRHWHTFDPRKVKALVITCAQKGEHSLELSQMFALQEMDKSLLGKFPFIDRYGQYIHRNWPGKVRSDDDITAAIATETELADELGTPSGFSKYGGWKGGPQLEATGFFRTEKHKGKWWFVDPEGYLFWSYGVNCVGVDYAGQTPLERNPAVFEDLPAADDAEFGQFHTKLEVEENYRAVYDVPHYDFTRANLYRKYGKDWAKKQVEQDIARLKYCHLNTIGAWSDSVVAAQKKVPYVVTLHYEYASAGEKLPDPFDPRTRDGLRETIRDYPIPFANDPWCLGAFVNNELHWKNDSRHLVAEILSHGEGATEAKKAFGAWLKDKYGTIDALNDAWKTPFTDWDDLPQASDPSLFNKASASDCSALAALFADAFFKMVREELSAYSPNVLYLGCRMNSASKDVIQVAAKYADVISANVYSYRPNPGNFGSADKPVLISEFHFANTSGNNLGSGLRSAQDAVQQGRLFQSFIKGAVDHPQIIGAHWYQWRDQSAAGRYDGENYNVGLFDVVDIPNEPLIRAAEECGRKLYQSAQ